MVEKYINLEERIKRDRDLSLTGLDRVTYTLRWLDRNPDQVPGQTITESEMDAKWDEAAGIGKPNFTSTVHRFTQLLGFDVIPDPEPTNAELLVEDLAGIYGANLNWTAKVAISEAITERGWVKAPGGDDD